ncbi:MAG TPA: peptidylprolyl isomerase [Planctomycetota bacterium]|nr:peptidylprolyl isomerase [Planctomycetota bacterium]HRR79327.1 peptidylprolyl isomerase [Planctomycetota bacterium]
MEKRVRLRLEALEPRQLLSATLLTPIDDVDVFTGSPNTVLDLSGTFDDPAVTGTTVRINTNLGNIDVELYDAATPLTVANFLSYMDDEDYWSSLIDRSVPGVLIQGGGYWYPEWQTVPADPPVQNEPGISNTRGTLAMWKPDGEPDGATSQWFINLADNSATFDFENGGYTVFGRVLGNGMEVADAIAAVPTYDVTVNGIQFPEIPLRDYPGDGSQPGSANVVLVNDIYGVSKLTLTVTNDNPDLVTATLNGTSLTLAYAAGQWGTATITVRATDLDGTFVEDSFVVTVQGRPLSHNDTAVTDEDQPVVIDVLANDVATSSPLDPASVTVGTAPSHGQTSVNPDTGEITYTPDPGYTGPDTFTYTVADMLGTLSAVATVSMTVNAAPLLTQPMPDLAIEYGTASTVIDLTQYLSDPDSPATSVRFDTVMGAIYVTLYDTQTPITVANFLKYVYDGDYASSVIHRSVPGFVLQGGGYRYPGWTDIPTDPPIQNEPGISNTYGTIAMAKLSGDPNSATSQWFFNLADNSANLDYQNGGFTVFGHVTAGMDVVLAIAALPTYAFNSPFDQLPLINYSSFPNEPAAANVVLLNNIVVLSPLTFQVWNDNPDLLTATVTDGKLTLAYAAGERGVANITVRGTDARGLYVEDTFTVEVAASPVAHPDSAGTNQGTPVIVPVLDNDVAGDYPLDPASVTIVTDVAHGATLVDPLTGAVTYTPAPGYYGPDSFTYFVADTYGRQTQTVTVSLSVNALPVLLQPFGDVAAEQGAPNAQINLSGRFSDPDGQGTIARFNTTLGVITVMLYDGDTPITVANFLKYVSDGDYNSTVIHRSVPSFVIQGGSYAYPTWTEIPTDPPIQNEFLHSNIRGTIAMAKVEGNPNSATSSWFFNLADNSANLDQQNGGFTVFGYVIDGMSVVDAIAALPTYAFNSPFDTLPLRNYTNFPAMPTADNVILVNTITTEPALTYTVLNDNTALVTATIQNGALVLAYAPGGWGTANITVRATDRAGAVVEDTFQVVVTGPPVAVRDDPTTDPSVAVVVNVLANDLSQGRPIDPTSVVIVTPPQYGAAVVDPVTGAIAYTPPAGFVGVDPFTYTVKDLDGRTSQPGLVNLVINQPGVFLGDGLPGTLVYTDPDGTVVTLSFKGGQARVLFVGNLGAIVNNGKAVTVGGMVDVFRVELSNTTASSSLAFVTAGGTTAGARLWGITGATPMGALSGPTMDLYRDGILMTGNGSVTTLVLRDVLAGADILLPGAGAGKGTALTLRNIPNPGSDITVAAGLSSLTLNQWVGSTLTAPWISKLTVTGAFGANVQLSGVGALKGTLPAATIAQITGGTWQISGAVGKLALGSSAAGWTLHVQGVLTSLTATTTLAGSIKAAWIGAIISSRDLAATITTTGANAAGLSIASLSAPRANGTTVNVPGGVGSVAVSKWLGGGITAARLNSLATKANSTLLLPGDFEADLKLTGTGQVLPKASIAGSLKGASWDLNGGVGSLTVLNSTVDWDCGIGGPAGKLVLGAVSNSELAVNGAIGSLAATNWMGGSLWAHSIGSLATTGSKTGAIVGHFTPDVQLTGQGVAAGSPTLGAARIAQGLALGTWDITGHIGSILAGFVESWTLKAHGNVTSLALGDVTAGNLTVDGTVNSLVAASWNGGTVTASRLLTATPGYVANLSLTIAGAINSISSLAWMAGTIKAAALGSLSIVGDLTRGIYADFAASLNLTGAQGVANTLGTVNVARRVLGGTWTVAGNIGTVNVFSWFYNTVVRATGNISSFTVGGMDSSKVYAGVASSVTGLPSALADFTSASTIGKFEIVGIPTTISTYSFLNSIVAARTISSVTLREVQTNNGGKAFGVAGQNLPSVSWSQAGAKYSWPMKWPGLTGDLVVRQITT